MKIELRDDNPLFEIVSWVIQAAATGLGHPVALHHLKVEEGRIYATNGRQVHLYWIGSPGWTPGLYQINPGESVGPEGRHSFIILKLSKLDPSEFPNVDAVMPDVSKFKHVSLTELEGTAEKTSVAYARIVRAMRPDVALNIDRFKATYEGAGFTDCFIPISDEHKRSPIVLMSGIDRYALVSPMVIEQC